MPNDIDDEGQELCNAEGEESVEEPELAGVESQDRHRDSQPFYAKILPGPPVDEHLFQLFQHTLHEVLDKLWRRHYKRAVAYLQLFVVDSHLAESMAQDAIQMAVPELSRWVIANVWPGQDAFDGLAWLRIRQRCIDQLRDRGRREGKSRSLPNNIPWKPPVGKLDIEGCIEELAVISEQFGFLGCGESQAIVDTWIDYLKRLYGTGESQFDAKDLWYVVSDTLSLSQNEILSRQRQLSIDCRRVYNLPDWLNNWYGRSFLMVDSNIRILENIIYQLQGTSNQMIVRIIKYLRGLQEQGVLWFDSHENELINAFREELTPENLYQRTHRLRDDLKINSISVPLWLRHLIGRKRS